MGPNRLATRGREFVRHAKLSNYKSLKFGTAVARLLWKSLIDPKLIITEFAITIKTFTSNSNEIIYFYEYA